MTEHRASRPELEMQVKELLRTEDWHVAFMESQRDALRAILDWCESYPATVFTEPDLDDVRAKLGDQTMSALHGTWARHLLSGIAKIAKEGLRE